MNIDKLLRPAIATIPAYVPGKPIEEVERELGLTGVIKMASNENPLGPSQEVRQALAQAIDKVFLYPDANNYYLIEALAAELEIPADWLIVGNGLDDANRILAETLLTPEDEVVIPDPTFSQYEITTRLMGAKPVFASKVTTLINDPGMLRRAITERTKLVYICNPNNPTGTYISRDELKAFLADLPPQVLVVLDEAYADFADALDFPEGLYLLKNGQQNLIVYHTFSKIHGMAGLRLGYAIADPALIREMRRIKDPFNVNLLAQIAGVAALGAKMHVQLSRELVFAGRKNFYGELENLGVGYLPTQANFILIDCGRDSKPIYDYLLQNAVIVRPTHSFGLPNHIRVTFGTVEQNDRFFRAFKEGLQKLGYLG